MRCRLGKGGAAGGPEAAANGAAPGQPKGMNLAAKLMEQMGWRGGGLGKTQQASNSRRDPTLSPEHHPALTHAMTSSRPLPPLLCCSLTHRCRRRLKGTMDPAMLCPICFAAWVSSITWRRQADVALCEPTEEGRRTLVGRLSVLSHVSRRA